MSDEKPLGKQAGAFVMIWFGMWLREWLFRAGQHTDKVIENKKIYSLHPVRLQG